MCFVVVGEGGESVKLGNRCPASCLSFNYHLVHAGMVRGVKVVAMFSRIVP